MTATLVDSNVIIDVLSEDAIWKSWSEAALATAAISSLLVINPIIYGEISVQFNTVEALEVALPDTLFSREHIPFEAAFLAGKCYLDYRRRGGTRTSPLPDFFVGAHAAVAGYRLLTRDARRYRTYFPTIEVIAPMSA